MPRKTLRKGRQRQDRALASMRPRPDAAENGHSAMGRGSRACRFNEAAARCRGKRGARRRSDPIQGASMRPRPDAAENGRGRAELGRGSRRFNEAAARCRGKLPRGRGRGRLGCDASMRPRPDAAENGRRCFFPHSDQQSFNEAAARCRGKHARACRGGAVICAGFNEAAARCRGKLARGAYSRGGHPLPLQ